MKTTKTILALLLTASLKFASAQFNAAPANMNDTHRDDYLIPSPTGYFELGLGIAQPLGSFARANGSNYSGYALPGNNLSLSFGLPINHSNFGVAVMYNYVWNAYDVDAYVNNIQVTDQNNAYNPEVQDAYRESFILGGLFATLPVDRFSFDFRLMGGVALCTLPEVEYEEDANSPLASQNYDWDTYRSTSAAFAFDAGVNLRFRINRTSIMAGVDYMATNPMVSTTQQYVDQNGNVTYTHVGGSVPVSVLSYSIGIGYQIW